MVNNYRISGPSFLDLSGATVTGTNEVATLPATNLQDIDPSLVFRSSSTSTTLTADIGGASEVTRIVDFFALVGSNLTQYAQWILRYWDTDRAKLGDFLRSNQDQYTFVGSAAIHASLDMIHFTGTGTVAPTGLPVAVYDGCEVTITLDQIHPPHQIQVTVGGEVLGTADGFPGATFTTTSTLDINDWEIECLGATDGMRVESLVIRPVVRTVTGDATPRQNLFGSSPWGAFNWDQTLLDSEWDALQHYHIDMPSTPLSCFRITCDITDTDNDDGYIDIGRMMLCQSFVPTHNYASYAVKLIDPSDIEERGRAFFGRARSRYRIATFELQSLSRQEARGKLLSMAVTDGMTNPWLWIAHPDDAAYLTHESVYGVLEQMPNFELQNGLGTNNDGFFSASFSIREL